MRSVAASQISESIHRPALFPDEQLAQQEGILMRVEARTGLDLHHQTLGELSRVLEGYDDETLAKLAVVVADCSNDEQLDRLRQLEQWLSIKAILVPHARVGTPETA